jgi:hypothetical protein
MPLNDVYLILPFFVGAACAPTDDIRKMILESRDTQLTLSPATKSSRVEMLQCWIEQGESCRVRKSVDVLPC